MREYRKDPASSPQRFRSILGFEVEAIQWRTWNQYPVGIFLEDECFAFDVYGNVWVVSDDGAFVVQPRDYIVRRDGYLSACSPTVFEQLYPEEL